MTIFKCRKCSQIETYPNFPNELRSDLIRAADNGKVLCRKCLNKMEPLDNPIIDTVIFDAFISIQQAEEEMEKDIPEKQWIGQYTGKSEPRSESLVATVERLEHEAKKKSR